MYKALKANIENKKARIGIVGLGYVGLPLAIAFARQGFRVSGFDKKKGHIKNLNRGLSHISDISSSAVQEVCRNGHFIATANFALLKRQDAIIVCVPTPLTKKRLPDVSYIVRAFEEIICYHRRGQLYVLESTTYPGTTDELVIEMFKKAGLAKDRDFFLAFSPERIDPGNKQFYVEDIPKVVGGTSAQAGQLAELLYSQIIKKVIRVSSSRAAEMTKLLENTFRIVNIGLANEMALLCDALKINIWEVIEAAKTKPFGFMPFYPGPGCGGHCISTDPLFLSWKARQAGFISKFIDLSDQTNNHMAVHIVEKVMRLLNDKKDAKIMVLGVTYKRDVKDIRESPALHIMHLFQTGGARVSYYDPFLPYLRTNGINLKRTALSPETIKKADCVVVATDHTDVDYDLVLEHARLIMDTRNVYKNIKQKKVLCL